MSHCWGKSDFLRLTTATLGSFAETIPWHLLPKTFQDAIKVCLEMGLSSIWIDSFCILQDSREDWEDQSACMAQIYRNATVVIAANSSSGAHEGFIGIREGLFVDCIIPPSLHSSGLYAKPMFRHYDDYSRTDETLETRAWTYQERILARRYLSFNKRELHWECESNWHCECGESEWQGNGAHEFSMRQLFTAKLSKAEVYQVWRNTIIRLYSGRLLTVASDRLPALSAVTQVFQKRLGDTFLAGLWREDMINGLCWAASIGREKGAVLSSQAPSWSWCSIPSQSQYRGSLSMSTHYSRLLKAECILAGSSRFGEVKAGYITLYGPLLEAVIELKGTQGNYLEIWTPPEDASSLEDLEPASYFCPDCQLGIELQGASDGKARGNAVRMRSRDADQDGPPVTPNKTEGIGRVWCLHIGSRNESPESRYLTSYALVLGTSPETPERFIRLGVSFSFSEDEHDLMFANAMTTNVTIK